MTLTRDPGPAPGGGWIPVAAALAILPWFLSPGFIGDDLPRALRMAGDLAPWRWDWEPLIRVALRAAVLAGGLVASGGMIHRWVHTGDHRGPMGLALGLAGWALAVWGAGLAGLWHPVVLRAAYLALAAVLVARILRSASRIEGAAAAVAAGARGALGQPGRLLPMVAIGWSVAFLLADVATPENSWDAIVYHLGAPVRWLEIHRVTRIQPFFAQFPQLMAPVFSVGLASGGEMTARAFHLVVAVALAMASVAVARRWAPNAPTTLATALVVTSPLLALLAVHAGSDLGAALFTVLCADRLAAATTGGRAARRTGSVSLAGLLAGCAMGCKLPGGLAVVAGLVVLAPVPVRALQFGMAAAAAFLPWGLRSWMQTGDPVFPLLAGALGTPFWPGESAAAYGDELARLPGGWTFATLFAGWTGGSDQARHLLALIGPGAAIGVIAATLGTRRPGGGRVLFWFVCALGAMWGIAAPAWRFFAAGLAVFGAAVAGPASGDRRWHWIAGTVLLVQSVRLPVVLDAVDRPWAAARGGESRESFYAARLANPPTDAVGFLMRRGGLRPGEGVLACAEPRTLLLPPFSRNVAMYEPDPFLAEAAGAGSERRLYLRLRQRGVRWLLVNAAEALRLRHWEGLGWGAAAPPDRVEWFFRGYARLYFARSAAWVYRIGPTPVGAEVPECWRPDTGRNPPVGLACASASRRALAGGDGAAAHRLGVAAVAAADRSGFAWAALGDALLDRGAFESATGAYSQALRLGWRTSPVYRNQAAAFHRLGRQPVARTALGYALEVDPDAGILRSEMGQVDAAWIKESLEMIPRARPAPRRAP